MDFEEYGKLGFPIRSPSDIENELGELVFLGIDFKIVHPKKNEARRESRPFVAVDKWMVLGDVVKVGGCHFEGITVEELSSKAGRNRAESRGEKLLIPDPGTSSIAADLVLVESQHLIQGEKDWI